MYRLIIIHFAKILIVSLFKICVADKRIPLFFPHYDIHTKYSKWPMERKSSLIQVSGNNVKFNFASSTANLSQFVIIIINIFNIPLAFVSCIFTLTVEDLPYLSVQLNSMFESSRLCPCKNKTRHEFKPSTAFCGFVH